MNRESDVIRNLFRAYYLENHWRGTESRSGKGSSLDRGQFLAERIPLIMESLAIKSILDVPCGDMNWMSKFPLPKIDYIGVDIAPEIIVINKNKHGRLGQFFCLDACHDPLPDADLVFCRDLLPHLSNDLIRKFLANVCQTKGAWLLCGRFLGQLGPKAVNSDIGVGGFRAIDLCEPPFRLPPPTIMAPELIHKWKTLALWPICEIRKAMGH